MPNTPTPAIAIRDMAFSWDKQGKMPLLQIQQWQVSAGERIFLAGKSGSGKSTLLNIIAGIQAPSSGKVEILGHELSALRATQRDIFRARHLGVIFQQFNLLPYLTVQQNMGLPALFSKTPVSHDKLLELMDSLKLDKALLGRKANTLSIGQQQRVAIARAIAHRPELIIADEPTSALDSDNRDEFIRLLLEHCQSHGTTVVFVSHDRSLAHHFDRAQELENLNQGLNKQAGKAQPL